MAKRDREKKEGKRIKDRKNKCTRKEEKNERTIKLPFSVEIPK